jgi:hypothetical protein
MATLPNQGIEVTRECRRNKQRRAIFSGNIPNASRYSFPIHAYRAGPALATIPFSHAPSSMTSKSSQDIWQSRSTK